VIGDDVIESDVDFEITSEAIVVRARSERDEPRILFGLLPVPGNFDTGGIEVRFEARAIDIHVYRVEDGSR
jgi:hypothetical protein